jgi:hypothetical protein
MDEHLDGLYNLAHPILKRLKMGDTGTIQCSKEYPSEEVMQYVMAYAGHKDKWFDPVKYDKATDTVSAKRAPVPNWETVEEIDTEEEL